MSAVLPKIQNLSKGVIRVLGCNPGPMTLQGTNTYILGSSKTRTLIDTGDGNSPEYTQNLKYISQTEGFTLSDIILTHWHEDHVGGVDSVLGIFPSEEIRVHKIPYPPKDPPNASYLPLENGQIFKPDSECSLQVIFTPGHTPDHVVLNYLEENIIFSGDCILGEGTAVFEDLRDYLDSLRAILKLSPGKIYPGHGPVVEDPVSRLEYYIAHRLQREGQILGLFGGDKAVALGIQELVSSIYTDLTNQTLFFAAAINVGHHLKKLVKDGVLIEDTNDSSLYRLK